MHNSQVNWMKLPIQREADARIEEVEIVDLTDSELRMVLRQTRNQRDNHRRMVDVGNCIVMALEAEICKRQRMNHSAHEGVLDV